MIDFAALQIFKAVAETGGISAAARKLHRVQSNVSTRIQQLEESLGKKLFIRDKKRMHLSPEGQLFLNYANEILSLSEKARIAVSGDRPQGVLRLGTLESTAASRLPPVLANFHRLYPDVNIELLTGTSDALIDCVLSRRVDAAFVAECKTQNNLELQHVFTEEIALITPKSHPPVKRPLDVNADTIIGFPSGCTYRRMLQDWLMLDHVAPDRVLELSSYHAIVACVAAGAGVAFAPRSVLKTIQGSRNVSIYSAGARPKKAITSLIWRRREMSPSLNALRRLLTKGSAD